MILASEEALSKKPPLQNRRFKWWEYVTILREIAEYQLGVLNTAEQIRIAERDNGLLE